MRGSAAAVLGAFGAPRRWKSTMEPARAAPRTLRSMALGSGFLPSWL